jgi:hypothetical protein
VDLPEGCIFNARTKGQHVSEVEAQIKTIKERARGVIATSAYRLSSILLMWPILFVVSRINLVGNSVTSEIITPNEAIYGRKVNYKKDLAIRFGDYCEIHEYDEVTNTMKARTVAAIALMSIGNIQGSWWFMKLNTGKAVRRERWVKMRLTEDMIAKLDNMADNSGPGSKGMDFMNEGRLIDDDMEIEVEAIGTKLLLGRRNQASSQHGNRWNC